MENLGCRASLAPSAAHEVCFPGRLVYPFKFLMKHYPIRSQSHGGQKVFVERASRWDAEERSLGWHRQYDDVKRGDRFTRAPGSLHEFDDATFDQQFMIERLSGIGVFREPPSWATGPRDSFGGTTTQRAGIVVPS